MQIKGLKILCNFVINSAKSNTFNLANITAGLLVEYITERHQHIMQTDTVFPKHLMKVH